MTITQHGRWCKAVYLGEGDWTPCDCGREARIWDAGFKAYRDAIDQGRQPSEVRNPYAGQARSSSRSVGEAVGDLPASTDGGTTC